MWHKTLYMAWLQSWCSQHRELEKNWESDNEDQTSWQGPSQTQTWIERVFNFHKGGKEGGVGMASAKSQHHKSVNDDVTWSRQGWGRHISVCYFLFYISSPWSGWSWSQLFFHNLLTVVASLITVISIKKIINIFQFSVRARQLAGWDFWFCSL